MIRLGVFFDKVDENETNIFSLYQQNHNKLLHTGQILSNLQAEILHQIILETRIILNNVEKDKLKIDIYGCKDGHDNAMKFMKYIRECYPDSNLLGHRKITD
ncbi:MAG: hypothetical protein ACI9TV_002827 [Sulfurimonas sp.]|jgi:hypothetical protein|uniref:hypothetical protein n=1 Tax=Sulfurimonas sp. TaxID=2022749 RepID=UPI0039E508CE